MNGFYRQHKLRKETDPGDGQKYDQDEIEQWGGGIGRPPVQVKIQQESPDADPKGPSPGWIKEFAQSEFPHKMNCISLS